MSFNTPFVAAAARNARPILGAIEHELAGRENVLEIGSGTAQQAVVFGNEMPWLRWQTSDLAEYHDTIRAQLAAAELPNVLPPLVLDVLSAEPVPDRYDAAYASNTAHIMSQKAVEAMFEYVGVTLKEGGLFILYGPFRFGGKFTTESNAAFDGNLRAKHPDMGLRDVEVLDGFATACGMKRRRMFAMPSNNFMLIWAKETG